MTRPFNSKPRTLTLVVLGILVVVLGGLGVYAYLQQHNEPVANTGSTPTPSASARATPEPDGDAAKADPTSAPTVAPTPAPTTGATPAATPTPQPAISAIITSANQASKGAAVTVRTVVSGATSGTCSLNASGPGTAFTKTAAIKFEPPGTYSCDGFDIAASQFSASGSWNLSLTVTGGGATSAAFTQSVGVEK
jgi:hypothetical protein